jgi:hypothetical protein
LPAEPELYLQGSFPPADAADFCLIHALIRNHWLSFSALRHSPESFVPDLRKGTVFLEFVKDKGLQTRVSPAAKRMDELKTMERVARPSLHADDIKNLIAKLLTDAQAPVRSVVALPGFALFKSSGRNK